MPGKLLILCGPSGSGKTTIVRRLIAEFPELCFSVSATTRPKRSEEVHGKDYYFLSEKEFREKIDLGEFVEWEEVYHGMLYGTLKPEIKRIWNLGKTVVFDVDVIGALNLKKRFPADSLALIVLPPSIEHLESRLKNRQTETNDTLERRLGKAEEEMKLAKLFDHQLVNDNLEAAVADAVQLVSEFLKQPRTLS